MNKEYICGLISDHYECRYLVINNDNFVIAELSENQATFFTTDDEAKEALLAGIKRDEINFNKHLDEVFIRNCKSDDDTSITWAEIKKELKK